MPNYELGANLPCWPLTSTHLAVERGQLEVYPNPAYKILNIKTESKGKRELYNSVGHGLFTTDQNEIDVSNLAKGVYYIKVLSAVKKIIIE